MERKTYRKEFKVGAARMVVDQKKRVVEVCWDLRVSNAALSRWVRDYKRSVAGAFPGKGYLTPEDDKFRRLEKENRLLRMERDLLKNTCDRT